MKKLFFAYAWFLLAIGIILTSVATVQYFDLTDTSALATTSFSGFSETTELLSPTYDSSGLVMGVESSSEVTDARAAIVAQFLERHNSPLQPYDYFGEYFVEIADTYQMDFRLLPAIAMQESNLCKKIPPGTYNCLGFGIHSRGTLGFESYESNFDTAARTLKTKYIDYGLTTPEDIMRKYTPSSNGSWASSVNQWMAEMRYNDRQEGRDKKENEDVTILVPEATNSAEPSPLGIFSEE